MEIKDPRQKLSIKKLQTAYLSLILKEETISIQRLCQEADVTRPTFYKMYKDLVDLRVHLHNEILEDLKVSLTIKTEKTIEDYKPKELPENMLALFEHISKNQLVYEVFLVHQPDHLFINQVKDIIRNYVEDGIRVAKTKEADLRGEIPFIIAYTTGAYLESIIWWIKNHNNYTSKEMAHLLLDISFHGPYTKKINWT